MELPHDLKNFTAESDDAFQILSGDACVYILCCLLFVAVVFRDWIR